MLLTLKLIIMKAKFKDFLLYSLACVGAVSLFLSATTQPQASSAPVSHVWEMYGVAEDNSSFVFSINKVTGEVRKYETKYSSIGGNDYFGHYGVATD